MTYSKKRSTNLAQLIQHQSKYGTYFTGTLDGGQTRVKLAPSKTEKGKNGETIWILRILE